jgi:transcriptional regulator with XRE-family HTH domain
MNQAALARESGMTPNNLSRLESPDYGKQTISSLKRIADALDVALVVRFVPFDQYIDWLSATPHLDHGIRPEALAVPSFEEVEKLGQFETDFEYFTVNVTPKVEVEDTITTTHTPPQPMMIVGHNYESGRQAA